MKDFSITETICLINLCNKNFPKRLNYSELSKMININQSDSRFYKIKKFLLMKKIINEIDRFSGSIFIKINKEKLKMEVAEIQIIRYIHQEFFMKAIGGYPILKYSNEI